LRNPSWHEIKDHVPIELAAAAARQFSTTRGDVARAMRVLPPEAQRGVISLMEGRGGQIRGQMAHQAARGDLDHAEREAFRTLAAATPEVRVAGIGDFVDSTPAAAGLGDPASPAQPPAAPVPEGGPMGRAPEAPRADEPRESATHPPRRSDR
jgi:hypothetical protein